MRRTGRQITVPVLFIITMLVIVTAGTGCEKTIKSLNSDQRAQNIRNKADGTYNPFEERFDAVIDELRNMVAQNRAAIAAGQTPDAASMQQRFTSMQAAVDDIIKEGNTAKGYYNEVNSQSFDREEFPNFFRYAEASGWIILNKIDVLNEAKKFLAGVAGGAERCPIETTDTLEQFLNTVNPKLQEIAKTEKERATYGEEL